MFQIQYDISKYARPDAPLSCKKFTIREVNSHDEDTAAASAKAKGKDSEVFNELVRLSVVEVDGQVKGPECPFVEWDSFNMRTRTFIIRAFNKLNAVAKEEGDDFLSQGKPVLEAS